MPVEVVEREDLDCLAQSGARAFLGRCGAGGERECCGKCAEEAGEAQSKAAHGEDPEVRGGSEGGAASWPPLPRSYVKMRRGWSPRTYAARLFVRSERNSQATNWC